jgi:hypothetical protein
MAKCPYITLAAHAAIELRLGPPSVAVAKPLVSTLAGMAEGLTVAEVSLCRIVGQSRARGGKMFES